jgi:hypothetical protein
MTCLDGFLATWMLHALGQERVHRPLAEQVAAQRSRVEQLPIRTRRPQHTRGLPHRRRKREHQPDCSARS